MFQLVAEPASNYELAGTQRQPEVLRLQTAVTQHIHIHLIQPEMLTFTQGLSGYTQRQYISLREKTGRHIIWEPMETEALVTQAEQTLLHRLAMIPLLMIQVPFWQQLQSQVQIITNSRISLLQKSMEIPANSTKVVEWYIMNPKGSSNNLSYTLEGLYLGL